MPTRTRLYQNYPNPFNPATTIRYDVARAGDTTIRIFNILGQTVASFEQRRLAPGSYEITWDGRNDRGLPVESGVYFYQILHGGGFVETRKMIPLK